MGFMDRAKEMAEQAQAKLDEKQQRPASPPPPAGPPAPPAPPAAAMPTSQSDAERIAPPTLSSGDPLRRA